MDNTLSGILKDLFVGYAPSINRQHLEKGHITPSLKAKITKNINQILETNQRKRFKFGKTGNAPVRADFDDYRKAPYKKMYILYQSTSHGAVDELEVYYIEKFYTNNLNDNKSTTHKHKMDGRNNLFILYLVI